MDDDLSGTLLSTYIFKRVGMLHFHCQVANMMVSSCGFKFSFFEIRIRHLSFQPIISFTKTAAAFRGLKQNANPSNIHSESTQDNRGTLFFHSEIYVEGDKILIKSIL